MCFLLLMLKSVMHEVKSIVSDEMNRKVKAVFTEYAQELTHKHTEAPASWNITITVSESAVSNNGSWESSPFPALPVLQVLFCCNLFNVSGFSFKPTSSPTSSSSSSTQFSQEVSVQKGGRKTFNESKPKKWHLSLIFTVSWHSTYLWYTSRFYISGITAPRRANQMIYMDPEKIY